MHRFDNNIKPRLHFTPFQTIVFGFMAAMLVGALLLFLPIATEEGKSTSFLDALFTSTSAVCVTGLVVYDTATHWSMFGEMVILILIQIGGLGVVTMAGFLAMVSGRKIGLFARNTMQEALSAHKVGGILRLTQFILFYSFLFEALGAVFLSPVFVKDFGIFKGIWYSVFHSISAFCNAGFDLMGIREEFSSLTYYSSNALVNITIITLIVVGGIGFLTWDDIRTNGIHIRKYRVQSKIIFTVTFLLILLPFIFLFFHEFSDLPMKERILFSLFQSVTPRTAGFNTVDYNALSETGEAMTVLLMLVGGSPGSTAGGMKTTTLAVLILSAFAVFRRNGDAECFGRRVMDEAVKAAGAIFFLYLFLSFSGALALSAIEDLPFLTCLFETSSAIGTVGLSLGITPSLTIASRIILIILMFMGRVGGLTLIYATVSRRDTLAKLPQERITVG